VPRLVTTPFDGFKDTPAEGGSFKDTPAEGGSFKDTPAEGGSFKDTPAEGGSFPGGFDRLYGLEVLEIGDDLARAQVKVRDELLQPAGLVHGGVFASIAESLTSVATWLAVHEDGKTAQGLSNQTSFLRPIVGGTVHATARRRHKGRTTWVWEVDITDDEDRPCALVRMTVAVREARS
jgi:1,4-dihydroxy-2-naphthoyl-CoA hydrolase